MTPDEVINQLKTLGVEISRPTLSRYESQDLIPKPKRGSLGRAGGSWTDYPDGTVEEVYAAWALMHGKYGLKIINMDFFCNKPPKISPDTIRYIRNQDNLKKDARERVLEELRSEELKLNEQESKELEIEEQKIEEGYPILDDETDENVLINRDFTFINAYEQMYEHLRQFLTTVWSYEVNKARERLNAK